MSQQYQPTGQQSGQTTQPYGQQAGQGTTQGMSQMGQGQTTGQQPTGQTMGQQPTQGMGQSMGGQFQATLPTEFRTALEDFAKVTQIAEWCADRCIEEGPQMAECARACEDLADLAELNEKMIARDSPFGPELAETFIRVATEGLPELRHHQQRHPHVAETVATIDRAINSCSALLESGGQAGPMQQRGGTQGGQMGQY